VPGGVCTYRLLEGTVVGRQDVTVDGLARARLCSSYPSSARVRIAVEAP
jgi:hypothetical protein